jgi:hypothetical protein
MSSKKRPFWILGAFDKIILYNLHPQQPCYSLPPVNHVEMSHAFWKLRGMLFVDQASMLEFSFAIIHNYMGMNLPMILSPAHRSSVETSSMTKVSALVEYEDSVVYFSSLSYHGFLLFARRGPSS